MEKVIYRQIDGYPNYRVGTDGTVWSFYLGRKRAPTPRWKQLKTPLHDKHKGRCVVNIWEGKKVRHTYVSTLVLEAFVGPRPKGYECCHFPDPNPLNNRLNNLMWGTPQENTKHQYVHNTRVQGEKHPQCKLSNEDVKAIRAMGKTQRQKQIAETFGITVGYVSVILSGKARVQV